MYEIFEELLKKKGVRVADVARATGITKGVFSDWKSGRYQLKADKLKKIAEYFGVTVDYLMGVHTDEQPIYYIDPETAEIAQKIFENPRMRALYDVQKDMSPKEMEALYDWAMLLKGRYEND